MKGWPPAHSTPLTIGTGSYQPLLLHYWHLFQRSPPVDWHPVPVLPRCNFPRQITA
jgi:hypothetical protein